MYLTKIGQSIKNSQRVEEKMAIKICEYTANTTEHLHS